MFLYLLNNETLEYNIKNTDPYKTHLVLAGTLAALAALAVALLATLAALAAHHLILASSRHVVTTGILAVLARIATITTSSVGHFILRPAIFFTRVGKILTFSRLEGESNLWLDFEFLYLQKRSGLLFH